jgi:hypothetical protein
VVDVVVREEREDSWVELALELLEYAKKTLGV